MDKQKAVIFDRDGTLASVAYCAPTTRNNEDWRTYNGMMIFDSPVPSVVKLLRGIPDDVTKIMFSGRMAGDKKGDWSRYWLMKSWLRKHSLDFDMLLMRPGGDMRQDSDVKNEMLDAILPHFNVVLAVDDRPQVCDNVWRARGIPLIQVVDPDIPPSIFG